MDDRAKVTGLSRRMLVKGAAAGVAASAVLSPTVFVRGARAQETTEVRLSGWAASPEEQDLLEQVIADFEAANPDVSVRYEPISGDYNVKLQTDLAAGNAPDVFYVDAAYSKDLASRGVLMPLEDCMASEGLAVEDFYTNLVEGFQWEGATYGLPKDFSPLAMVYDMAAFEDAGIANPPTTWDELRTTAEALLESTGQPPIVVPAEFDRFILFLYQAGARVTNPENTELAIDDPATLEALQFFNGLFKDGLAATHQEAGAEWPGDAIVKGLASIVFEGNWFFPYKEENAPDLELGVAEMPAGPGGKGSPAFPVAYSISANTEVADAACKLLAYLVGPEGMAKWTSLGIAMPSRPDLAEAWLAEFPEREPYIAAGEYAIPRQFGPGTQEFVDDANAILQSLRAEQIDEEEAQTQLVEAAQEDLELAGTA